MFNPTTSKPLEGVFVSLNEQNVKLPKGFTLR
jgi:hypothetical protein